MSGTTPILRDGRDDGPGSDDLDFEDVGPTTIEAPFEPLRTDSREPAVGALVGGRYRIERLLGRGAAGVVYAATHEAIGKRVALKCLGAEVAKRPDAVARFFREALIAAAVDHPNVVSVFDGGRDGDRCFLAMELVEGESLGVSLARGVAPVAETVQLFLRITHGVAAVHDAGVVHRDLKPENILLAGPERTPKVLDFGISKLAAGDARLTTCGAVMGTPFYMAPEQVTDTKSADARADVYSLGVMLYEALTGRLPYEGDSVLEIFRNVTEGRCPPAHALNPDVPPALSAVVAEALCPDREARHADVRALREALASVSFDERDAGLDFDERSEPWMLLGARQDRPAAPLETAATRIGPPPAESGARPALSRDEAQRLVTSPAAPPFRVWALLAASSASIGALLTALAWWLSSGIS